jgi:hypothetical protein
MLILHPQAELFLSFVYPVLLGAITAGPQQSSSHIPSDFLQIPE